MRLAGRVALVTGGGRRVGRALALALGRAGARVAVHYGSSADGARRTVEEINGSDASDRARAFQADLTLADAPAQLVAEVVKAFGSLDVLINSAAVMIRTPFGEVSAAAWDEIMALNLRAPFLLAQAAAPHLRQAGREASDPRRVTAGSIVNIADLAAFETWPGYIPHGVSKSGVVYLTKALARVLAPEIRVNGIAPGTVLLPDDFDPEAAAHLKETTPLKRQGSPDDVAAAMLFLLESDYITGEVLIVDGGRHVRK